MSHWMCDGCTLLNEHWRNKCKVCKRLKSKEDYGASGGGNESEGRPGSCKKKNWTCPQCTFINQTASNRCGACRYTSEGCHPVKKRYSNKTYSPVCTEDDETRIVLIGRTGTGKSATGNNLLGRDHFRSLTSGSSVTEKCKRGESKRKGKKVVVVDTPGLFDTGATNETVTREIIKCIGMTSPGPHAMVLVVSVGRFTKEEQDTVKHFVDHFGEGVLDHMIVLFTRKDDLSKSNQTIGQYVKTVPKELKTILSQCGNRFIAFNNDAVGQSKTEQVDDFYEMVESMCNDNGGSCYTNELYKEAESALQRRMRIEREVLEEQKEKEKEKIRNEVQFKYKRKLEHEVKEKSKLENALKSKKIESEKDKVNLQKQLEEASQKLKRELGKKEKELREQVKKKEDEFKQKMTEEALKTNQRNNVENEKGDFFSDLMGGLANVGKKLFKLFF
ncbi:GTPase IMAP family member 4 [Mytilus coruscus]|uniref:GTPase IMAP family member 4 n=1 Tax=Mytilus coruscus TaxID=42192 RepID=A0A6J8CVM8_MYTCO|nr:GTPase IMAP family member 4 [Mytilus coruscus]